MPYRFCIIILFFTFTAYSQTRSLEIFAKDLSEDATIMSSHNDELVLLIYNAKNTGTEDLGVPVWVSSFVMDTLTRNLTFNNLVLKSGQSYVLFLVENDDGRSVQQIEPVVRVYWQTIMALCNDKKYIELATYLGDNDLLGYTTFNFSAKEESIEIKGRQSLDTYHYLIKIK